ncbi:phospholipase A2 inhibitor and Ly6/PLAUR domain-containing protein isoform X2 [Ictalurus punctatus]|uniref:Phospholipase A2 inhibitor and Ly6/PLAUR domain-containing protein isoform X2 n=1 Tax=Ictalurus punctatus TaxID=7998 RepID=A0A2D0SKY5_ICTPU|nr:phospholipase A2 inhibitor and Ly6/PLAUR domain-containing protein isoform X2 [Ictalurus punctatus]
MTPSAMELQVTLILSCLLFSTALALQCYLCVPDPSGNCENTVMDCPDQCGSMTLTMNIGGTIKNISTKSCMSATECVNGSVNLADLMSITNTKCCTTDLCNEETPPALTNQPSNGQRCYACAGETCSGDCQGRDCINTIETVDCVGNEDRCINITVSAFGFTTSMEGCATKSVCDSAPARNLMGLGIATGVQCCEGYLCNIAESNTLSFLVMLVPLLSSIIFY